MNANGFKISRGTNISGTFIAPYYSSYDRYLSFNSRDIRYIARFGLDHVRIPISEEIMWDSKGSPLLDRFRELEQRVEESIAAGLRVILCVHGLRSHPIFGEGIPTLFKDPEQLHIFVSRWQELSDRFKHYDVRFLAYEILNEPRAPEDDLWNAVLEKAYTAIRERESNRTLLFGSNFYQIPERIKSLFLPENDRNIIRTFHLYYPMLLTHYRAEWLRSGSYKGPVQYPGRPIPNDHVGELVEPLGSHMGQNNNPVSKIVFKKILKNAGKFLGQTPHPLHCGEFGCIDKVPAEKRGKWYADVVSALEEESIPWTHWDWKGNFGILNQHSWKPSSIHIKMGLRAPKLTKIVKPSPTLRFRMRRFVGKLLRKMGLRKGR